MSILYPPFGQHDIGLVQIAVGDTPLFHVADGS